MSTADDGRGLPHRGHWLGSDYLDDAFDPDSVVADARTHLRAAGVRCDTLVGTGLSGALIIPILARELGVDYAIVRAPGPCNHARTRVEGFLGSSWLFVDDHISTGHTFRYVYRAITDIAREHSILTTLVGSFCYQAALREREPVLPATTLYSRYLQSLNRLPRNQAQNAAASAIGIRRSRRNC
ncbi:phosphoribosyltransferase [Nocardia nova]|uniref:phosphoribosyltransferase n=1 Tax=Nocardia nova TaxID=37330 RepID=UPI0011B06986|nr:phosphoribosyltransferase [Nocardia nova]